MKRILILGAPVFQIEVIKKAKDMGCYVGVVDINDNAPAFTCADESFVCSIRDYEGVLNIARAFKPDGIMSGACDTSVVTGAKVSSALGLPGHSIVTAINSTDKVKMLETFEMHKVAHPLFQVVKREELDNYSCVVPYPLITKPTDSAGGRGVCIVHNKEELDDAIKYSSCAGQSGNVLLEEYMRGPEVSVEVIVVDGKPYILQITDKITSGEPNFFEIGHSQPSVLSCETQNAIKTLASEAVVAVGINNSPAHVEIIITENGPKMVELGARLGGDCITSYLINSSVSGINMTEAAIELSLGIKPIMTNYKNSGLCAAVRFIPTKEGVLKAISGIEDAKSIEGVEKIFISGQVGKQYSKATDDSSRLGYVVCTADSTKEALRRCQNAIDTMEIELE